MSLFFVDSGCDLDLEQIRAMGVECINLPYMLNENTFSISSGYDFDKFYSKTRKGVCIVQKLLSKQEYIDIFDTVLKNGDDIIYVHSSSAIIDYESLLSAKDMLLKKYKDRKFELIDSLNLTIGQGILSYLLALQYRNGNTVDEIVESSYKLRDEFATYFMVDSAEQLNNYNLLGGNALSGSMLNIKPIITIDIAGKLQVVEKISGRKKAINKLIEIIRQSGENVTDYPIGIVYTNNAVDVEQLEEKIYEYFGKDIKLFKVRLTPSNCALLGNGVLGLSFHVHRKIH